MTEKNAGMPFLHSDNIMSDLRLEWLKFATDQQNELEAPP